MVEGSSGVVSESIGIPLLVEVGMMLGDMEVCDCSGGVVAPLLLVFWKVAGGKVVSC